MMRYFLLMLACVMGMTANAWAGPKLKQIDLIGLKPGVTTKEEVAKLTHASEGDFVIGGHRLFCFPEYRNDKLDGLLCYMGRVALIPEELWEHTKFSKASNIEIHTTLYRGLVKKLGKPDMEEVFKVRNGMGQEFENHLVIWQDLKGNQLRLLARAGRIDSGILILQSAENIKAEKDKREAEERSRKF
ncbi:hypothetical protein D6779_02495 [Candidatus Parcubacteria bacterium]|nr:MAG: hypothetical protein D6779_02495 [Candidatus Parcubacteria bacterium]